MELSRVPTAVSEKEVQPALPAGRPAKRMRRLTEKQRAAISYVMGLFVDDDLALGVPKSATIHCSACEAQRPRAGAIPYGSYLLCNRCATEYEIARVTMASLSIGRYLRDKRYGDGERYELPAPLQG